VVYDCEGYVVGVGLAELLADEGHEVEIVTPLPSVAPFTDPTLEGTLIREHLRTLGVLMRTATTLDELRPGGAAATGEDGSLELEADAIVLVTQRVPGEHLYIELDDEPDALAAAGITGLFRIGDCTAP